MIIKREEKNGGKLSMNRLLPYGEEGQQRGRYERGENPFHPGGERRIRGVNKSGKPSANVRDEGRLTIIGAGPSKKKGEKRRKSRKGGNP